MVYYSWSNKSDKPEPCVVSGLLIWLQVHWSCAGVHHTLVLRLVKLGRHCDINVVKELKFLLSVKLQQILAIHIPTLRQIINALEDSI